MTLSARLCDVFYVPLERIDEQFNLVLSVGVSDITGSSRFVVHMYRQRHSVCRVEP